MAMPSVQICWRWFCDIAIICCCSIYIYLMCVPCGNSLKILGNVYARGSASWGVIEEDLSGASSARVRFSVGIAAAHVRFFEASYVRRSDVFSCKTLSLGKPSGQVHWYHWWPFAMPWPGHCCQWHWVPSLQTSARVLWSLPLSLSDHDKLMALP